MTTKKELEKALLELWLVAIGWNDERLTADLAKEMEQYTLRDILAFLDWYRPKEETKNE